VSKRGPRNRAFSQTDFSMVTEQIVSIDFKDGQFVKKGELLAQLDPSTFQAAITT
jgi:multidrug efflux pump subunit AcrA (membrane-fusion protein)